MLFWVPVDVFMELVDQGLVRMGRKDVYGPDIGLKYAVRIKT